MGEEKKVTENLKLHLGCGKKHLDGFINCDIQSLPGVDKVMDCGKLIDFKDNSAELIFCNSFFEHLYLYQQAPFLAECKRVLQDNGTLIILGIPDFEKIAWHYCKKDAGENPFHGLYNLYQVYRLTHGDFEENGKESIPQMHKTIFDKESLYRLFEMSGFKHSRIFNYYFPGEKYNTSIGISAGKEYKNCDLFSNKSLDVIMEYIDFKKEVEDYNP